MKYIQSYNTNYAFKIILFNAYQKISIFNQMIQKNAFENFYSCIIMEKFKSQVTKHAFKTFFVHISNEWYRTCVQNWLCLRIKWKKFNQIIQNMLSKYFVYVIYKRYSQSNDTKHVFNIFVHISNDRIFNYIIQNMRSKFNPNACITQYKRICFALYICFL